MLQEYAMTQNYANVTRGAGGGACAPYSTSMKRGAPSITHSFLPHILISFPTVSNYYVVSFLSSIPLQQIAELFNLCVGIYVQFCTHASLQNVLRTRVSGI
jgi:hypothetical protein